MEKVKDLDIFKSTMKGAKTKGGAALAIAGGLSFTVGAYLQTLENNGVLDKKTKWTLFGLTNATLFTACAAQHYDTIKRVLNVFGEVELNN